VLEWLHRNSLAVRIRFGLRMRFWPERFIDDVIARKAEERGLDGFDIAARSRVKATTQLWDLVYREIERAIDEEVRRVVAQRLAHRFDAIIDDVISGRIGVGGDISRKLAFLLDLFLPPDRAQESELGLERVLTLWIMRYGKPYAHFICCCHVVSIIVDHHLNRILRLTSIFRGRGDGEA
jgi:hypothetical protein